MLNLIRWEETTFPLSRSCRVTYWDARRRLLEDLRELDELEDIFGTIRDAMASATHTIYVSSKCPAYESAILQFA